MVKCKLRNRKKIREMLSQKKVKEWNAVIPAFAGMTSFGEGINSPFILSGFRVRFAAS